jgi:hypothetical protein
VVSLKTFTFSNEIEICIWLIAALSNNILS